jgi:purine-binding chemotaxis protein CheW
MEAAQHGKHSARAGQYLTFVTAGEEYAVHILKVKEIVEYGAVTVVPNTPGWIRGVTNLRGSVVPVIDLAVKFALPASRITKFSCIIITEVASEGEMLTLGVLADLVNQVLDLSEDDIEDAPSFGTPVKLDYLLGIGRIEQKFCLILDIDKVLSTDELLAVAESSEAESEGARGAIVDGARAQAKATGPGV